MPFPWDWQQWPQPQQAPAAKLRLKPAVLQAGPSRDGMTQTLFELLPAGLWQCYQHQVVTEEVVHAMSVAAVAAVVAVVVTVMANGAFSMG